MREIFLLKTWFFLFYNKKIKVNFLSDILTNKF